MQSKTQSANALLTAHNLSCVRGENQLFQDLSFHIETGQCLHVIGPNGSGKTSLLRILCNLDQSETGMVLWGDTAIKECVEYAKQTFYLGHKDALKNELTAIENLRFVQALDTRPNEDKLDEVLARMQILHCADLTAQSLSFGQRRRLAFAKILLSPRTLWVLDEPFTGIDEKGRKLIEELCIEHLNNAGSIILTHHQSLHGSQLRPFLTEFAIAQS